MQPEQRRQLLLAALVVVLAFVIYRAWPSPTSPPATGSGPRSSRAAQPADAGAPDVKLEALDAERPRPDGQNRNLFRFGRPPAPPAPPGPAPSAAPPRAALPPAPPPAAPSTPPIPLKFVGTMKVGPRLMVVLADADAKAGRDPVYGFEGDTVLGQYKIVRVTAETVEMSYLDGRGRQTLKFSGP
jgi:hypothetical protein